MNSRDTTLKNKNKKRKKEFIIRNISGRALVRKNEGIQNELFELLTKSKKEISIDRIAEKFNIDRSYVIAQVKEGNLENVIEEFNKQVRVNNYYKEINRNLK